jgi:hypothetical protein
VTKPYSLGPEDPDWAFHIVDRIHFSVMDRVEQHLARGAVPGSPTASAWDAKGEISHEAIWRAARQLWGDVPDEISREAVEDGDYDLLNRIVLTADRKAHEAVEIIQDEFTGRQKREDKPRKILIRVKRHSISVESVFVGAGPHLRTLGQ